MRERENGGAQQEIHPARPRYLLLPTHLLLAFSFGGAARLGPAPVQSPRWSSCRLARQLRVVLPGLLPVYRSSYCWVLPCKPACCNCGEADPSVVSESPSSLPGFIDSPAVAAPHVDFKNDDLGGAGVLKWKGWRGTAVVGL
jgi:hypothetical protein